MPDDWTIRKNILKSLPRLDIGDHAPDSETIYQQTGKHTMTCQYCGGNMHPYRDYGGFDVWACDTFDCPNCADFRKDYDVRSVDTLFPHNKNYRWNDWIPKRLI